MQRKSAGLASKSRSEGVAINEDESLALIDSLRAGETSVEKVPGGRRVIVASQHDLQLGVA